jgi:hypothetical protein
VEGVGVCERCARSIAFLAREAEHADLSEVWSLVAPPKGPAQSTSASRSEPDAEKVFADLERGLETTISPNDGQAHLDLAVAYSEMGLHVDALREAAIAAFATGGNGETTSAALKALLTRPLMRAGGLVALRRRLEIDRNGVN